MSITQDLSVENSMNPTGETPTSIRRHLPSSHTSGEVNFLPEISQFSLS
ncbi:hypothetical protein SBF1_2370001 [Candidatus Desulfosporosinus infrequens]|uniref:Uncharacterized protein n=1 Tax=Candidatus Desulfosporosinus infrequens TaxID=2043169 RepID=A0A2U3KMI7_9FIRM|nr:hypothetical protein SBF1_2370001 [Candidatus Desulfosporosinus infrequens]